MCKFKQVGVDVVDRTPLKNDDRRYIPVFLARVLSNEQLDLYRNNAPMSAVLKDVRPEGLFGTKLEDSVDWSTVTAKRWIKLLKQHPNAVLKVDWTKFTNDDWVDLLRIKPGFVKYLTKGVELTSDELLRLLTAQPRLAPDFPDFVTQMTQYHRAVLFKRRPELFKFAPMENV